MGRRTPLYEQHLRLGARMVDFGGWDMPVHYGSQIEEHHAVRRLAGVFDVSHMCVIDLEGERTRAFLETLIANDVGKLQTPGKALYSCLLNEAGGVLDDLIVYYLGERFFRVVVNAGTRDKDLAWIRSRAVQFDVEVRERTDLAILAVRIQRPLLLASVVQQGTKPWFGTLQLLPRQSSLSLGLHGSLRAPRHGADLRSGTVPMSLPCSDRISRG